MLSSCIMGRVGSSVFGAQPILETKSMDIFATAASIWTSFHLPLKVQRTRVTKILFCGLLYHKVTVYVPQSILFFCINLTQGNSHNIL